MWFDILKVLGTKSGFSQLDFDNIVIEDDKDCKRWLRGLYEIYEELYGLGFYCQVMGRLPLVWEDDRITEDAACQIKEYLETQTYPMTDVYGNAGILTEYNYYISYYVEDYFEFSIGFYRDGETPMNPSLRMHFGTGLMELMSDEYTRQDVYGRNGELKKYYDGFKRICKYIGNKSLWDKFKSRLDFLSLDSDIFGDW